MRTLLSLLLLCPSLALAGVWGQERWGRMYWGDNPATAPVVAPEAVGSADGQDIIIDINNYIAGSGEDGWSVITGYRVTCNGVDPVTGTGNRVTVTNLEEETTYNCTVVAINSFGSSSASSFTVTTEAFTPGGLPIWLLYQATQTNN